MDGDSCTDAQKREIELEVEGNRPLVDLGEGQFDHRHLPLR